MAQPLVKLKGSKPPAPRLLWYNIMCGDKQAGELLAAFELFLVILFFICMHLSHIKHDGHTWDAASRNRDNVCLLFTPTFRPAGRDSLFGNFRHENL